LSAKSCSSSPSTTSLGQNGASAGWAWCFAPRNALFFRRRAPRLWSKMGLRPVGRGASLPPMPCSFVAGHHAFWTKWGFGRLGVVLRSPQCLVLSSPGTTSLEQNRIRPVGRGASLPPMPCSFVDGHHVFGAKSDFGRLGVVLRSPQCLVLSSPGTTSSEQNRISAGWAWCFIPRKATFFRRRAPRLWSKIGFGRLSVVLHSPQCLVLSSSGTTSLEQNRIRPVGRGASLPAMPCSFVDGHHVFGAKSDFGRLNVVLRSPQYLVLSSTGTTSLEQNRISAGWAWCFAPRNALFFRRRAPRQRVPLNKKPASGKKSQFQLTLMKGDEVVKVLKKSTYFYLLSCCRYFGLSIFNIV